MEPPSGCERNSGARFQRAPVARVASLAGSTETVNSLGHPISGARQPGMIHISHLLAAANALWYVHLKTFESRKGETP